MLVLVATSSWFAVAPPAEAATVKKPRGARASATAASGGLDLAFFGTPVSIGSSAAAVDSKTAIARGTGVDARKSTAISARVDTPVKRQADRVCLPDVNLFELLSVQTVCGESRTQTLPPLLTEGYPRHVGAAMLDPGMVPGGTNPKPSVDGGPQAVGRGSAARVEVRETALLEPTVESLRTLLKSLLPGSGQTVGAAAGSVDPASSAMLRPLAAGLGLRPADIVDPIATLLEQFLQGAPNATALVSIVPPATTATTNTKGQNLIAFAHAERAQIDLLPGLAADGLPLLSILVGPAESTMILDRTTAARSPSFTAAVTTIRLNLPLAGADIAELTVRPGSTVTLLAGTPLETTVSVADGRKIEDPEDGPISSIVDGVSVQLLKGVKRGKGATRGIDLRLARVESGIGGEIGPPGGRKLPPALILGACLALAAAAAFLCYAVRRRSLAAR